MDEALILETTFLIDLEREALRNVPGPAHAFLEAHRQARLCLTVTTAGELAAGLSPRNREHFRRVPDLRIMGYGEA